MPVSRVLRRKPILVGELNPYGGDEYYALYPAPDGCAGHRLCCRILGMRRADYLDKFERVNLCTSKWSIKKARLRAIGLTGYMVLLGARVAGAFGLHFTAFDQYGDYLMLPHPSGLNRMWNEAGAVERARMAVCRFLPHLSDIIGVAE